MLILVAVYGDALLTSQKRFFLSFRRKSLDRLGTLSLSNGPESRNTNKLWTPASAGVTALMTFANASITISAISPTRT